MRGHDHGVPAFGQFFARAQDADLVAEIKRARGLVGNRIEITEEEIIGANPDVIIIGSGTPDQVEALKADSAWTGVKAVQDGAVYANPSGVFPWDRYSGEEALQVLWAAKALNPDTFSDIDMVKEVKKFHDLFHGFDMTDDQAQMMLAGEKPA